MAKEKQKEITEEPFWDFSLRLDRIIDGSRQNLNFVMKHKVKGVSRIAQSEAFYEGMLYAYKNLKTITKELRQRNYEKGG